MNALQIIKVHNNLWASPSRSFNSIRVGSIRFVTQNMTKKSKNTDWINGDPEYRKLTWIFDSRGYRAYVREYRNADGRIHIEIHKLSPDVTWYKAEKAA